MTASALMCLASVPALAAFTRVDSLDDTGHEAVSGQRQVIVDTRSAAECRQASLTGAHCLGIAEVMAPGGRLATWPGITWLLGTHGLDGSERIIIVGENAEVTDAMAAILFLAGQAEVVRVDTPLSELLSTHDTGPGVVGGATRARVYTATMRSERIVLGNELVALVRQAPAPTLFDGRSEAEYRGLVTRGPRGGHIPGATHWNAALADALGRVEADVIVYGLDTVASLALLGRVLPRLPNARVYIDGWVAWSTDVRLPVDALTYAPARGAARAGDTAPPLRQDAAESPRLVLLIVTAILALAAAGIVSYLAGRFGAASRGRAST